jgi:hypothetical protein
MSRFFSVGTLVALAASSWIVYAAEPARPAAPAERPSVGARAADPLANLKPHEERRYRMDLADCAKEQGAERRVCERAIRSKAAAKSRRRGAAGY